MCEPPDHSGKMMREYLGPLPKVNITEEMSWGLTWPFEFCNYCGANWMSPFETWTLDNQLRAMWTVFQRFNALVSNIVSDEAIAKTTLRFYGLDGPDLATGSESSHVDWSRANDGGHPGVYSNAMLDLDPTFIRRVSLPPHACMHAMHACAFAAPMRAR
jgi:hypothetical protein